MEKLIASVSQGVPAALSEVITLGRTLKKRADDVLAYFDHQQRSDWPTRAPAWLSPRVPQSHQLHRPIAAGDRRLQNPTTPSIVKSPFT